MEHILVCLRHGATDKAGTTWKEQFENPLSEKGNAQANRRGVLLRARGLVPQLVLSSPAPRCMSTATIVSGKYNLKKVSRRHHFKKVSELTLLDDGTVISCNLRILLKRLGHTFPRKYLIDGARSHFLEAHGQVACGMVKQEILSAKSSTTLVVGHTPLLQVMGMAFVKSIERDCMAALALFKAEHTQGFILTMDFQFRIIDFELITN